MATTTNNWQLGRELTLRMIRSRGVAGQSRADVVQAFYATLTPDELAAIHEYETAADASAHLDPGWNSTDYSVYALESY